MENETIWKVGLVVLVLLVVVGIYNNNNRFSEEATGEVIGDSITGKVIGDVNEKGIFSIVGIGTSSPTASLDVNGIVKAENINLYNANSPPSIKFYKEDNTHKWVVGLRPAIVPSDFMISDISSNADVIRFIIGSDTGNVGIGTSTPSAKLDVVGGPSWTTVNWKKAIKLGNVNAIQFTTGSTMYGIGASSSGDALYFIKANGEGSTASLTYPMVINNAGDVKFAKLGSSGNVYVCADNSGKIYKSKTPCV